MIGMGLTDWMPWLKARTEPDGHCLVWQCSFIDRETPRAGRLVDGKKMNINVRRLMHELTTGQPVPPSWVVVCTCETFGCVQPRHLKAISRTELQAGKRLTAAHKLALTLAARERETTKLTQDAVMVLRDGDGSLKEKAQRLGVTYRHAQLVVRHAAWREVAANPFAGLMR